MLISSVGGHLEQLLSLKDVIDNFDSYIVTEKNESTKKLTHRYPNIYFIPYISRKSVLRFIFNSIKGFVISFRLYLKIKPDVIITTGSGSVISMCIIGKILGSKVIYIETFSRIKSKTLTGTLVYYFADIFIIQWEELQKKYPKAKYIGYIY